MSNLGLEPNSPLLPIPESELTEGVILAPSNSGRLRFWASIGLAVAIGAVLTTPMIAPTARGYDRTINYENSNSPVGITIRCQDANSFLTSGLSVRLRNREPEKASPRVITAFHKVDEVFSRPLHFRREPEGFYLRVPLQTKDEIYKSIPETDGQILFVNKGHYRGEVLVFNGTVEAKDLDPRTAVVAASVDSEDCR